jgi:hypothetical protein
LFAIISHLNLFFLSFKLAKEKQIKDEKRNEITVLRQASNGEALQENELINKRFSRLAHLLLISAFSASLATFFFYVFAFKKAQKKTKVRQRRGKESERGERE